MSAEKVRASHVLVKHEGSRRPASWRDPGGATIKATSRAAAMAQLQALRDDIVSGKMRFAEVASEHSDCTSAKRSGDLGWFVGDKCRTLRRCDLCSASWRVK
ncbi:hypothetical protein O6H91_Y550000 [Diphasiastrum complanatum]|nr:hypothetical protein O6H91_Y550000 [Diphasiastrum complanatum]